MRLRAVTPDDAPALAAIYAPNVRDTAISFESEPPDAAAMRERIAPFLTARPWLVAELDGAVAGYAYGGEFRSRAAYRWSVETTVYVAATAHRRGLARALYTALFALLEALGYRQAFAGITLPNDASVGFHRAFGFTEAGVLHRAGYKFGRWHDVVTYERAIGSDLTAAPAEPLPLSALPASVLRAALG